MRTKLVLFLSLFFLFSCASERNFETQYQKNNFPESAYQEDVQREDFYEEGGIPKGGIPKGKSSIKKQKGISQKEFNLQKEEKLPKIIYEAFLSLEVRSIKETQDKIIEIMKKQNGFLSSQTTNKIIIRVPAKNLDQTIAEIVQLGIVLEKKIFTYDVSEQYTDIEKRLEIALKTRERLLNLLTQVKKVEEKVRILEELRRVTREIESYRTILTTMDSFINDSVIEILLSAPQEKEISQNLTPFPWINALTPDKNTLEPVSPHSVVLDLPEQFVLFEKEKYFLARNPTGSFIRVGKTKNEPFGDAIFWKKALSYGMYYKNYEKIEENKTGILEYSLYQYRSVTPYYYWIGITTIEKTIYIVEVFFPDKKELDAYLSMIVLKMKDFKIK